MGPHDVAATRSIGSPRGEVAPAPRHVCTIVPPFLLEHLTNHGPESVVQCAGETLSLDSSLRAERRTALRPSPGIGTVPGAREGAVAGPSSGPRRTIADAHNTTALPGTVARHEGDPAAGDADVDQAYDGLGSTWSMLSEAFAHDSLDGAGAPLLATVHYGERYDNAFWNGERMVFGDGDGVIFASFTRAVDVIGHELAHGLIQHTANLVYQGQPGALNESIADVFGSLTKQHARGQAAAEADWLIGDGLFTPAVRGVALRSMKAPGTAYDDERLGRDPQPGHMRDFVHTEADNGGVHINSGIPNRAFCLAATGIGGYAWERAGQVWYDVLVGGLGSDADFLTFAQATVEAAQGRYGAGGVADAVERAWREVGVLRWSASAPPGGPPEPGAPGRSGAPGRPERPDADAAGLSSPVVVERSGGLLGGTVQTEIDPAELPRTTASAIQQILDEGEPAEEARPPLPDGFVYRLRTEHTAWVTVTESRLAPEVRAEVEAALRAAPDDAPEPPSRTSR